MILINSKQIITINEQKKRKQMNRDNMSSLLL